MVTIQLSAPFAWYIYNDPSFLVRQIETKKLQRFFSVGPTAPLNALLLRRGQKKQSKPAPTGIRNIGGNKWAKMGDSSTRFCRTPCVGLEFVELVELSF